MIACACDKIRISKFSPSKKTVGDFCFPFIRLVVIFSVETLICSLIILACENKFSTILLLLIDENGFCWIHAIINFTGFAST
jgi:hypothetical protein